MNSTAVPETPTEVFDKDSIQSSPPSEEKPKQAVEQQDQTETALKILETGSVDELQNAEIHFEDQREGTDYYGTAKFKHFSLSSRDYVSDGFKKYFILAFKSNSTDQIAYVFDELSSGIDLLPLRVLKKEEGQCTYSAFVKAREKFHSIIAPKENVVESKDELSSLSKKSKSKTNEIKNKKQPKKKTIRRKIQPIEAPIPVRRSPRIAKPSRELSKPSSPVESNLAKKKPSTKKLPKSTKRVKAKDTLINSISEFKSKSKSESKSESMSESGMDWEELLPKVVPQKKAKPIAKLLELEPKKTIPIISKPSSSEPSEKLSEPVDPPVASYPLSSHLESTVLAPASPVLIPLSWHEERLAKIRDTYLRQAIFNLQMNEMMQLTSPTSINLNKL